MAKGNKKRLVFPDLAEKNGFSEDSDCPVR